MLALGRVREPAQVLGPVQEPQQRPGLVPELVPVLEPGLQQGLGLCPQALCLQE